MAHAHMAMKEGEVYVCSDPKCCCEIRVTKSAAEGKGGDPHAHCSLPHCCCGKEMQKK